MAERDSQDRTKRPARRLLHRADQATVALLTLAGLLAMFGWYWHHGGLSGRMLDVDQATPRKAEFQVDINKANWPELVQIPSIGEKTAAKVIESRELEGPFLDNEDLLRVKGIGPKTLEKIRPYLAPRPGRGMVVEDHSSLDPNAS